VLYGQSTIKHPQKTNDPGEGVMSSELFSSLSSCASRRLSDLETVLKVGAVFLVLSIGLVTHVNRPSEGYGFPCKKNDVRRSQATLVEAKLGEIVQVHLTRVA